jgi:hypothetical protein
MKMTCKQILLGAFFCCASLSLAAQKLQPVFKEISLRSLDAFQSPYGNWQVVGAVQGAYDDTLLTSSPGTGVLLNAFTKASQFKPGHELKTRLEHGDLLMEADIMVPKGSNSGIYFQSRYEVQIFDSWRNRSPRHSDMGGLYERWKDDKGYEGSAPLTNASFAPGLWQHLEVSFKAPRFDATGKKTTPAKFAYVKLNGVTIHENIFVSGPTRSAVFDDEKPTGPLLIQGDHGPVAIRNIKLALQEDLDVKLSDISYKYYEKTATDPVSAARVKPTVEGKTEAIDVRVAPSREEYFILYEGKMNMPKKDSYRFSLFTSGVGSLDVDGRTVIAPQSSSIYNDPLRSDVSLDAGLHSFRLWMNKTNRWEAPAIALFVEAENSRAVPLHAPASIPDQTPAPLFAVKAEKNTEIIRSFMEHEGRKLTHVLSVGDPGGINYSYDLLQGGVLQVWRGDFLNTSEMWYERGEPQTASPLGAAVVLPGTCPVFNATNSKDSIADYKYKGYTLNGTGSPVFKYVYRNINIVDQILPADQGTGLNRNIKFSGEGVNSLQIRAAQGKKIAMIRKGVYGVDDGRYFIRVAENSDARIVAYKDQQLLVLNPANDVVNYQIIW